ncbi:MAG: hypothetical protein Q7R70_03520 [Candidatus Diapherotrites archaeon]|nr:hypothetical protein [Candidatus Diapherotrites archaeon]
MATTAKTVDKWKKKKWFKIFAPPLFDKREIGETPAEKPENVMGRTVKANVRALTGQIKKAHVDLIFKIMDVQGLNASTEISGMIVKPETLRRVVRRRNSKIDVVLDSRTKDNKKARIKATVVCLKKIERIKETAIRKKLLEELSKMAVSKNFEDLISDAIFGNSLNSLFASVKTIAGIKRIEIMAVRQLND